MLRKSIWNAPVAERWGLLPQITLQHGSHQRPADGMCVQEAISWVQGQAFGDHPICVSPTIGTFLRAWNDALPDDATRTRLLVPLMVDVVNTAPAPPAVDESRAWLAFDWLLRVYAPTWLDLVPSLAEHASALRQLPQIVSTLSEAELAHANTVASAARSAAKSAAESAAWSAARSAAESAAWSAAESAARSAGAEILRPPTSTLQESAQALVRQMATLWHAPDTDSILVAKVARRARKAAQP